MADKSLKVIVGVLVIVLVVMSGIFITALNSGYGNSASNNVKILTSTDEEDGTDEVDSEDEEEKEIPITGTDLEKASAAALAYLGNGRVTDSEVGDEDGYYEIEVRLDNGEEADVHLDENFNVISVEYD